MITIERLPPDDQAGFVELGDLLLEMAAEIGLVPVDTTSAARQLWLAILEGNAFVARNDEGRLVGSLALVTTPYWYNMTRNFWVDHHFYVAKDQRFALVGVKLLRAARELVEPKGDAIFVRVVNQGRHRKATTEGVYSTIAGFMPVGHLTLLRRAVRDEVAEPAAEA